MIILRRKAARAGLPLQIRLHATPDEIIAFGAMRNQDDDNAIEQMRVRLALLYPELGYVTGKSISIDHWPPTT